MVIPGQSTLKWLSAETVYNFGALLSTVTIFFNPPFLNPVIEFSNAPLPADDGGGAAATGGGGGAPTGEGGAAGGGPGAGGGAGILPAGSGGGGAAGTP